MDFGIKSSFLEIALSFNEWDQYVIFGVGENASARFDNLRYVNGSGTLVELIDSFENWSTLNLPPNTAAALGFDQVDEDTDFHTEGSKSLFLNSKTSNTLGILLMGPYDLSAVDRGEIRIDYSDFDPNTNGMLQINFMDDEGSTGATVGLLKDDAPTSGTISLHFTGMSPNTFAACGFQFSLLGAQIKIDNMRVLPWDGIYRPGVVAVDIGNFKFGDDSTGQPNTGATMTNGTTITTSGSGAGIVPNGVSTLDIEIWGSGSNGGGRTSNGGGGGGQTGGYSKYDNYPVAAGQIINYTVGAQPAAAGTGNGANGNATTVNVPSMTAPGGNGGQGGANSTGGTGASTPTGGTTNTPGGNGTNGGNTSGNDGGAGGTTPGSGGASGATKSGSQGAGNNGTAPGGAGSGGKRTSTNQNGGRGANGGIKFSW